MKSTRIKYEVLKKRITDNDEKIHQLLSDSNVQSYLNLIKENEELIREFTRISPKYEFERMRDCSHIYLINNVPRVNNRFEPYEVNSYYCPKCQLDTYYKNNSIDSLTLTIPQREMWNLYVITKENAQFIDCCCTPTQADEIYEDIINKNPNISDDELIEHFKSTLDGVEIKEEERHIKHLTLRPGYKKNIGN